MSAASYNRGTRVIRAQIDDALPSETAVLFSDLLGYSIAHDGAVPFQDTVIRFGPCVGQVSLMNRQKGGWSELSFTYGSLWELVRAWRIAIVGTGRDEYGEFLRVIPVPR